jgi:hypothetical protein
MSAKTETIVDSLTIAIGFTYAVFVLIFGKQGLAALISNFVLSLTEHLSLHGL